MTNPRLKVLVEKYLSNTLTSTERTALMAMLDELPDEQLALLLHNIETPDTYRPEIPENEISDRLDRIKENLFEQSPVRMLNTDKPRKGSSPVLWKALVAACLCAAIGWTLYQWKGQPQEEIQIVEKTDVDPAEPVALITLATGETIRVDSTRVGLIYSKNGLHVYKSEEGEIVYKDSSMVDQEPTYLTIHTPKGGFTKLKLDDGTLVELNAASSIRYPTSFEGDKRDVFVEGEAFFKVQHDKERPFRVHSQKQMIEVLGTSFNLISDEKYAKTTLIEGSVKVVAEGKDYFLKPGQQAVVSDKVVVKDVKASNSVAWKDEKFVFDNSSFKETLKEVENWYDVQMVFFDPDIENVQLSGTVSRNVKLSELLKVLEMNTNYRFEIRERRVLVRRY
ncbi:FecR family protein [Sphingobacterium faecale]|uniref:FecR family protein n=1 Tax=Sphingobacterium faecale TaxID=2803775 RepID=A0ABS1R934_9SPHI|nr:FecR family protein [Sphingobacterium faecale]MBL1410321.1 FecR family protein [Sphingobacterium faecale]